MLLFNVQLDWISRQQSAPERDASTASSVGCATQEQIVTGSRYTIISQAPVLCYALNPLVLYFNGHPVTSMTPALILIAPLPLNKVEVLEKGANQLDDVGWVWLVEGPRSVIINDF